MDGVGRLIFEYLLRSDHLSLKMPDRTVPCLRRATAVEYGDSEEDGERLLNFLDDVSLHPIPPCSASRHGRAKTCAAKDVGS